MGVDDAGDAHPAPGDLLDRQRVGQQRLTETAVLLGDHQAEQPELLEALDDLGRVLVGVLELLGDRDDLLVDELPHRLEDLGLVLGEAVGLAEASHDSVLQSSVGVRASRADVTRGSQGVAMTQDTSVSRRAPSLCCRNATPGARHHPGVERAGLRRGDHRRRAAHQPGRRPAGRRRRLDGPDRRGGGRRRRPGLPAPLQPRRGRRDAGGLPLRDPRRLRRGGPDRRGRPARPGVPLVPDGAADHLRRPRRRPGDRGPVRRRGRPLQGLAAPSGSR